ncbi:MAG: phytanoyl-CoA dioxygenase family protein [Planctomycetota bacterium]
MDETLEMLGVSEALFADDERRRLDDDGYVVLHGLLDALKLDRMREAFERAVGPAARTGDEPSGTRHAGAELLEHSSLDVAFTHRRVLAGVYHVLERPFQVFQLGARDPLPGYGLQGLHADWPPRVAGEPYAVATALFLLDDFRPENGATRVVPGSHRSPAPPPRSLGAPDARHPDEELVLAPAGSVLLFNGHLWHAGTRNRGAGSRRVIQVQFAVRVLVPPGRDRPGIPGRLDEGARRMLGA